MIIRAEKGELFRKKRRNLICGLIVKMEYNCQTSSNPEPYRVALFWLDVAHRTWGWGG